MSTPVTTLMSPDEYLAAEREADFEKSEHVDGVVYPKAGVNFRHVLIVANLTCELGLKMRGRAVDVLPSQMKVRTPDSRKFFYPDITVLCGEPQCHDDQMDVVLNPVLLIEVYSEETEALDRGLKFQAYQQFPTLREYLLVAQDKSLVEQFVRQDGGTWSYRASAERGGSLFLPSIECTLGLEWVYHKVD